VSRPKLVSRSLHPEDRSASADACNAVAARSYAAVSGQVALEIRKYGKDAPNELWRCESAGSGWNLLEEIPSRLDIGDGYCENRGALCLYLDSEHNLLLRFLLKSLVTENYYDPAVVYPEIQDCIVKNTLTMSYQISRDEGQSWDEERQLIQSGPEFDAVHWASGVEFKRNGLYLTPPFQKRPDGAIITPYHCYGNSDNLATFGSIQAGRFVARWREDLSDLDWDLAGRIPGGGCEQASAYLQDGRLLSIVRAQGVISPYFLPPRQRPYSVSEDDGATWSDPRPLTFDDGSVFVSSASYSQVIRSSATGSLYWLGNLTPMNLEPQSLGMDTPRCDPRYPLYIAEIDEDSLTLKRDTLTIIEDREFGESSWIRFSNFQVYEDRQSQEIVVLMMKAYAELEPQWLTLPTPSYLYRIRVDG
jgi:hypothetical protein